MKFVYKTIMFTILLISFSCSNNGSIKKMENGLLIEDLVVGDGAEAKDYNKVVVNYTGK